MIEFSAISEQGALIRFGADVQLPQVQELVGSVRAHLQAAPAPAFYVADCRSVQIFSPQVSDALIGMMKADNPMISRTGVLITKGAMFGLQVERMLREAGNPARRTFSDTPALMGWLAEVAPTEYIEDVLGRLDAPPLP